jgi:Transposase DDE domain
MGEIRARPAVPRDLPFIGKWRSGAVALSGVRSPQPLFPEVSRAIRFTAETQQAASSKNFARADADGLRLLAPLAKGPGRRCVRTPQRARNLDRLPATARARRRLNHPRGRDDYKLRARTVEPVFWQLKTCQKVSMMSRRGPAACENEWLLACAAHNLRKLHRHRAEG